MLSRCCICPSYHDDVKCPHCDAEKIRRSGRAGALERLLSVAYIFPYRCQRCGKRFLAMNWGARYQRPATERREYERVAVRIPVTVTTAGQSVEGETVDVSIDGCSLRIAEHYPAGTAVRLTLRPPGAPIDVEEAVVRVSREGGFGVYFARITGAQQRRLADYIHTVSVPLTGQSRRAAAMPIEIVLVALVGLVLIALLLQYLGILGGAGG
jgi:transposase-like protein